MSDHDIVTAPSADPSLSNESLTVGDTPDAELLSLEEVNDILAGRADDDLDSDYTDDGLIIRTADITPEAQALFDAGDNAGAFAVLEAAGLGDRWQAEAALDAETDPTAVAEPALWEDLEDLYGSIGEAIGGTACSIQEILNVPGLKERVEYPDELAVAVQGLNKDLNHFTDKLIGIRDQHKDQHGEVSDPDTYIDYLSIGDQYRIIAEEFMAVTAPALLTITEHTGSVFAALSAEQEATREQTSSSEDPDTTTTPELHDHAV